MKPHIVLLVLDSIRAESTSLFGSKDRTTPGLEVLANESVVYSNAISTCVSTVPAHASIFTGTFVSTHDLYVDGDALSSSFTTLAEALAQHGYKTFGVCYQDDVSPVTGLHRGFDQFDMDDEPGMVRRVIRQVVKTEEPHRIRKPFGPETQIHIFDIIVAADTAAVMARLDNIPSAYLELDAILGPGRGGHRAKTRRFLKAAGTDEPVFIYLHYDEAHLPYRPPVPFRNMFVPRHQRSHAALINQNRNRYFTGESPISAVEFETLRSFYHGAIAFLDAEVMRICKCFGTPRCSTNTMLIVMGDHGDNVGEHGLLSHKFCVYDTLTRVPLLIRYPKGVSTPRVGECNGATQ